jgi:hypothetical protein
MNKLLSAILIVLVSVTVTAQQVGPPTSRKEEAVRKKVAKLSPRAHITVVKSTGEKEPGNFISAGVHSFVFYDVDDNMEVNLPYAEVDKIRNGYGGMGVSGRHVDGHKQLIIVCVLSAGLVALIVAAATAKN